MASLPYVPQITVTPVLLNPSIWPPCPLCTCDINHCDCDPDEVQGARLAALMNKEQGNG